ncbi:glycoside hydrolase family 2 [Niabella aurantiaca]|uniref:glycoside hydrolase family 2 n=1 Tax=Niabella aurantiaca TaxID=379900 RepID=UPI000593BDA2|nr:glycoside hydrolase family 2 [Niabella aurantiaca]
MIGILLLGCQLRAQQVRDTVSLNEQWVTVAGDLPEQRYKGFEQPEYNTAGWKPVTVPHNWDDYYGYRRLLHGNLHGNAWYKKKFTVHKRAGRRYFLFFEGVSSYATVWVNGKRAGAHAGGRTSFTIEVTDRVHSGNDNDLSVLAAHPAGIQDLPWVCGGCSEERGFSEGSQPMGIFRPVRLITTNPVHIPAFGVHAWAEITKNNARLFVRATVKNDRGKKGSLLLVSRLKDHSNRVVAQSEQTVYLKPGDSSVIAQPEIKIAAPRLWSVKDPYLYQLETIIKKGAMIVDRVVTDFGFRTLRWDPHAHRFLLNGQPLLINGVAGYEHQLGQSHAFSQEEIISRVKWLQAAGFNAFRDAHQPHNLLYGKLFNQKGILWWTQLSAHIWYDTPAFRKQFKTLLREWVIERRNDPSLILWGIQNESKLPEDFTKECTELIRSLDPTTSQQRLVTTCNGGKGADWDVPQNWTGTYGGDPDAYDQDLKKQVLVGEYGAWRTIDLHTEGGFAQHGPYSEDRMTLLMEKKLRLAEQVKDSVAGHFFWLLASHDNPGRVQGGEGDRGLDRIGPVNYKGMLTSWEEPTDVYYMYRANYSPGKTDPMVYIASHTWPGRWRSPGIRDSIAVYSNCDEVELFNDVEASSLGRKKNKGRGVHFQWDHVNIRYNVLYAVGFINGQPVARDTIVLHHLPQAPHFARLYKNAGDITKPVTGYHYIYRVNCGGPDYKDIYGNTWQADRALPPDTGLQRLDHRSQQHFWGSSSWADRFPGIPSFFASQRRTFAPVRGTRDWPLFQTFRYGKQELRYRFPLPDGDYQVELYFMEPWLGIGGGLDAAGMRLFDVALNQRTVLVNLDIWKEAGTNRALKKTIPVTVRGGQLAISFPRSAAGQALVSAIAVAAKKEAVRAAPAFENVTALAAKNATLQSWLDIGMQPFTGETVQIGQLPPELFGADWIRTRRKMGAALSFRVQQASDVYVAVAAGADAAQLKNFEVIGTEMLTDEAGGRGYPVYKKRFPAKAVVFLQHAEDILVAVTPSVNMQPAFDLKPVTSYKTDKAAYGSGIVTEVFAGAPRSVVQTDAETFIQWPVKTGVADIYNITLKYYDPSELQREATLVLTDAGGNRMVEQQIPLKFTRSGKWNLATVNTGSMINAGHYTVRLLLKNAKGLVVSNIDIQ